ncbi:hypothetical protein FIM12_03220 [SAR202 cluster bacterium AD-804-J14_MRT_500m]|nr:hypothetical protein [SAR202 cluster bacterium AD-804-J14_MRT_500m]
MFGNFLLDQGVELELQAEFGKVLEFMDKDLPHFQCGNYGYNVSSSKGVANSQWQLMVKPRHLGTSTVIDYPVGYLMLEKLSEDVTGFRIPPRTSWEGATDPPSEAETRLFASFVFQILNGFQNKGYIELPGVLPTD